ncbi:MAG: hypothetical protein DMG21_14205 [Acidobacteria bacterium]|nr:MAG: hypothetical protein DMG21_14205 [Acidobacteriota bacterium]
MNLSAEFRYLFFFFLAFFILYSPLDFFRDSRPPPGGRSASSNSCIVSEYFIVKKKVEGGKSFRRSRERRREEPGARTASFASKKVSATALAMSMTHSFSALKSAAARGVATLLGVTLLSVLPFAAQQSPSATPPAGTLKVTTSVVNVFAVVKDRGGHLVPDLDKDDFEVTENNTTQEIRYFSRETDTPLTLGILVDTSPSQERVLPIEQEEAKAFVRQVIRPKDIAFVMHFDSDVELLQDFTSDTMRLARAIDETTIGGGGPGGGALPSTFPGVSVGGTHLYDAVYLAATDPLKNEIGRKVVIVLTDGVDEGSTEKLNSALEAALLRSGGLQRRFRAAQTLRRNRRAGRRSRAEQKERPLGSFPANRQRASHPVPARLQLRRYSSRRQLPENSRARLEGRLQDSGPPRLLRAIKLAPAAWLTLKEQVVGSAQLFFNCAAF